MDRRGVSESLRKAEVYEVMRPMKLCGYKFCGPVSDLRAPLWITSTARCPEYSFLRFRSDVGCFLRKGETRLILRDAARDSVVPIEIASIASAVCAVTVGPSGKKKLWNSNLPPRQFREIPLTRPCVAAMINKLFPFLNFPRLAHASRLISLYLGKLNILRQTAALRMLRIFGATRPLQANVTLHYQPCTLYIYIYIYTHDTVDIEVT